MSTLLCPVCHQHKPRFEMFSGHSIRESLLKFVKERRKDWELDSYLCLTCLNAARCAFVEVSLRAERGVLTASEQEVVSALEHHEIITADPSVLPADDKSLGARLADKIASFGGSWFFITLFLTVLICWIALNSISQEPFDPFPFILLNLLLSCIAAIQAPIIMMSQNRKEAKDRYRSELDYKTNLKAELEIRHLHIKLDQLISQQWHRLLEIQQVQMELLRDLASKK